MVIKQKDLPKIRAQYKGKKIVFCSGAFDLTHVGHVLFFEDCKKLGDVLVVAIGGDALTRKVKGASRPILNENIRLKTVDSLKPVDFVFLDETPLDQDPFTLFETVFQVLQPDIYVVNHDASNIPARKVIADRHGISLVELDRFCPPEYEGISTTKIIEKVKNLSD